MKDVQQITTSINDPKGDVRQILKNLNQITGDLRETVKHFNTLAQSGNQKLDGVYLKVDRALDRVNSSLDTVDKAIPKLIGKADMTLDNVQSATNDIKRITSESSGEIPSLVRNTNALVQDGQETVKGVQKTWLLNGLFPKPDETVLPVDVYVPIRSVEP